jgi:hypothetical protein
MATTSKTILLVPEKAVGILPVFMESSLLAMSSYYCVTFIDASEISSGSAGRGFLLGTNVSLAGGIRLRLLPLRRRPPESLRHY